MTPRAVLAAGTMTEGRQLLTPVVDMHAEQFVRGQLTNRDRLLQWTISNLGPLLDEHERLIRERDSYANSDFERQLDEARQEVERLTRDLAELREASGVTAWANDVRLAAKFAAERDTARAELE